MSKNTYKADWLYQQLTERIIKGRFHPDTQLVISRLSKEFLVSEQTVRDAVRRLHWEGVVKMRTNSSAMFRQIDSEQLADLYHWCSAQEGYAARLAATVLGKEELEALRELNKQLLVAWQDRDFPRHSLLNQQFHLLCSQAGTRNHFGRAVWEFWRRWELLRAASGAPEPGLLHNSHADHEKILVLLEAESRDLDEIEWVVRNHRLRTGQLMGYPLPPGVDIRQ